MRKATKDYLNTFKVMPSIILFTFIFSCSRGDKSINVSIINLYSETISDISIKKVRFGKIVDTKSFENLSPGKTNTGIMTITLWPTIGSANSDYLDLYVSSSFKATSSHFTSGDISCQFRITNSEDGGYKVIVSYPR